MDPTYHCPLSNKNTGLVRASFEVPCHLWGVYTSDESEASRLDSRDNNLAPNSDPRSRYSDYRDALYLTETTTPNTRMLSASTPKLEKRFRDALNIQPFITSRMQACLLLQNPKSKFFVTLRPNKRKST